MNSVDLIGRLVRDPEVRYTNDQKCVAKFTLAVRRDKDTADFPRVTVFGKQAETVEKYLRKGREVGVHGRIQTGSYKDRDGDTVYTTDVICERLDLIGDSGAKQEPKQEAPNGFESVDEDVPF